MATWKMVDESYPKSVLLGWSELQDINGCTFFDYGDDAYVVYYDADRCFELREYAVYTKHDGRLHCLLQHAATALNICLNDPVNERAFEVYHRAALRAGFPEHIKHYMTWREIRDKLNELDDKHLDMTAWVWCHGESLDGEIGITDISCYYHNGDLNEADDDNHISLSIDDLED